MPVNISVRRAIFAERMQRAEKWLPFLPESEIPVAVFAAIRATVSRGTCGNERRGCGIAVAVFAAVAYVHDVLFMGRCLHT